MPAFIEPCRVGCHVVGLLVAGGMLELHVRIHLGDADCRIHVAKRCGEDETVPGFGQLGDHPVRVGAFRHVLDVAGLDLIAERFFDGKPPLVVLVGPSVVADRADVDESPL